jgi:pre-60S factor REI1
MEDQSGVFCSTAGEIFDDRDSLSDHYKSEFHRYNLKRKVAGLAPVTREFYEARRAQLSAASGVPTQKTWFDPLTRKKFFSENTYLAYTRSKKYQDVVKTTGQPAPPPVITLRRLDHPNSPPPPPLPSSSMAVDTPPTEPTANDDDATSSGWETASDNDDADGTDNNEGSQDSWEEWDICRSLFDNKISSSLETNLGYMWKTFGFYIPDAQYCSDPEGLIKYLGAKLQYGHVPLQERGDNPNAKSFHSLHAVQRHMVDVGKCKILFDGNEEEYDEFYDYSPLLQEGGDGEGMEVDGEGGGERGVMTMMGGGGGGGDVDWGAGGYELIISGTEGGGKIIGNREFARYYKQRHKGTDGRASAIAAKRMRAQYSKLSVPLLGDGSEYASGAVAAKKAEERYMKRFTRDKLRMSLRRNLNDNNPKNVPY